MNNLCSYFWPIVLTLLVYGVITIGCIGLTICLGIGAYNAPLIFLKIMTLLAVVFLLANNIDTILDIIFNCLDYGLRNIEGTINRSSKQVVENTNINIFFSWIKAKKQQVCPLIKYVD